MKQLPVNSLYLVAVCHVAVVEAHPGDDNAVEVEVSYEVYDQTAFDKVTLPTKAARCDCCGKGVKYVCVLGHRPTGDTFLVGRACAAKVEVLKAWTRNINDASVRLAEQLACNGRELAALAKGSADFRSAYAWAGTAPEAPAIAKDIKAKIRRWGNPSQPTQDLLVKVWKDDTTRRAAATGKVEAGRRELTGTILSTKLVRGEGRRAVDTTKVLLDLGNGVKLYGNAPAELTVNAVHSLPGLKAEKGQRVTFTATTEPSKNDPLFGFWKRPTNWRVTSLL